MNITFESVVSFFAGAVAGAFLKDFLKGATNNVAERIGQAFHSIMRPRQRLPAPSEYFRIGRLSTSLFVIDGNGKAAYASDLLTAKFRDGAPDSPDDISDRILRKEIQMEERREAGDVKLWDGIGVGISRYSTFRDKKEKHLGIDIEFYKSRYAAFQATVVEIGTEDRADANSIYQKHLKNRDPRDVIPYLARHVGVVAVVITCDERILMTKRTKGTGVRRDEFDVSVCEGIEPTKDADLSGEETRIDVFRTVQRGCDEELGFVPSKDEVSILGLGVDMQFYQYNFIAVINSRMSLSEIASLKNGRAKDGWETRVVPINYSIVDVLEFINSHDMWGFAHVALFWSLVRRWSPAVVDAQAAQIVMRESDWTP